MRPVKTLLFAAALSAATIVPALAQQADPPPAVKAFLDNLQRQTTLKPAYDTLTADGSGNATITNLTLAQPAAGDNPAITVKLGEVTFSGITEESPSLYQVAKAGFNNVTFDVTGKDGTFTASIPQAGAEGWYIRALGENPTPVEQLLATSSFARKMNSGKITLSASGQALTVDGAESTWEGDPNTGAGTFNLKISNIAIPEALMALMDEGGMLKQLGYTSLNFDVTSLGNMTVANDNVGYSFKLGIAGRDIATISMGAELADIPLAVYAAIMKAHSEGKEPDYDALMPQMQNILLNGASLRFEDQSIVNKVLPMAAAMQGMDENTFRASIGPMVQLALVQFQNEAFTKQATEAITAFFANPKSLTFTAKPATALKVSDFATMDPNKPGDAISRLGLTVTAND
jgi:hypothetical protein